MKRMKNFLLNTTATILFLNGFQADVNALSNIDNTLLNFSADKSTIAALQELFGTVDDELSLYKYPPILEPIKIPMNFSFKDYLIVRVQLSPKCVVSTYHPFVSAKEYVTSSNGIELSKIRCQTFCSIWERIKLFLQAVNDLGTSIEQAKNSTDRAREEMRVKSFLKSYKIIFGAFYALEENSEGISFEAKQAIRRIWGYMNESAFSLQKVCEEAEAKDKTASDNARTVARQIMLLQYAYAAISLQFYHAYHFLETDSGDDPYSKSNYEANYKKLLNLLSDLAVRLEIHDTQYHKELMKTPKPTEKVNTEA